MASTSRTNLSKPSFPLLIFILVAVSHVCSGAYHGWTLYSGEKLYKHESLKHGPYTFRFGADCRLELLDPNPERETPVVWESREKKDYGRCTCELQYDGNLVVRGTNSWAALEEGRQSGKYVLILRNDRDAVIYGPALWSSGTQKNRRHYVTENHDVNAILGGPNRGYILYSDREPLKTGEFLEWGKYSLKMQPDCNLVLYDSDEAVWSTDTAGAGTDCYLKMQKDANLVLYDGKERAHWAANITSRPELQDYAFVLQDDRNMVVYDSPIWRTDTYDPYHPAYNIVKNTTAETVTTTNGIATVV